MHDKIREFLYNRFIEPTKAERQHYVGIEIEMPVINLNKEAVDFDVIQKITALFIEHFGFDIAARDDEGMIYSTADKITSDTLSYDCSYNNLELSLGCSVELNTIYSRFKKYYSFLQTELGKYNYTLTGMGINPYRIYNNNVPIQNGRYRMLFHHLSSYDDYTLPMYFHHYPDFGLYSSASQVQLDVDYENIAETINTFGKLEPIKSLLFSNSPLNDETVNLLCSRDMFWENSTHGINPHNIGMFDCEFSNSDEILDYIESCSLYCTDRDGKYINFPPVPVTEYFKKEKITGEYFADGEYHSIEIKPELSDLLYLRTFKFEDLTFRGTIEYRSVCCQPISDCMASA
ncbi:MAG: glutamylcysteine synthetase, partial [Oscillospiraceae bacterium]|nr:glutamylcysteine synthetase [Oscillospiraceae bacterium]